MQLKLPDVRLQTDRVEIQNFRRDEFGGSANHLQLRVAVRKESGKSEIDNFNLKTTIDNFNLKTTTKCFCYFNFSFKISIVVFNSLI